jgi:phosphotransferase system enzyme I (PtsI)
MLEDPQITQRTVERIRAEAKNAEYVFWGVTKALGEQMKALGDEYFAERNHDLYDIARRVLKFLQRLHQAEGSSMPREGCIIVAQSLGPAETAQLSREQVIGFCMNEGGSTSHAAIMAKALAIPAIVGLDYVTHYVRTGDMLILDGREGRLILNPSAEQVEHYKRKAADYQTLRLALSELRDLPAVTTDGVRVHLLANIEFPDELDALEANGAEGIGLFRTEFLYLDSRRSLAEQDHFATYHAVYERLGDRYVVLRTLDVGGDKVAEGEAVPAELNPFLGLRAIRLCMQRPELLRVQMRAMLKAAAGRELCIMIPMISNLDEVRSSRQMLNDLTAQMADRGEEVPSSIRLGIMVEIPSAALQARQLAREVDFFSIGTNDLIQYTLAVDRVNNLVSNLYKATHPAVLQLIRMVAEAGNDSGTPVSVCGEMASDPRLAILLVGLGVRTLSMGPSSIGAVKRGIRSVSLAAAEDLAREVLTCCTSAEVESVLHLRLGEFSAGSGNHSNAGGPR